MRVFAPGRSTAIQRSLWSDDGRNRRFAFGVPLEGDWIDIPDYFRQVTSGLPINDVVHAKVVDSAEISYCTADFTVSIGSQSFRIQQSQIGGYASQRTLYLSATPYHSEKVVESLGPPPSYKGKKRTVRVVERTKRIIHPFAAAITVNVRTDNTAYRDSTSAYGAEVELFLPRTPDPSLSITGTGLGSLNCYWVDLVHEPDGRIQRHRLPSSYRTTGYWYPKLADLMSIIESYASPDPLMPDEWKARGDALASHIGHYLVSHWIDISENIWATIADRSGSLPTRTWSISHPLYAATDAGVYSPDDLRSAFVLNEADVLADKVDPMLLGVKGNMNSYWRHYLVEHALLAACESLPRLSDNSIQNLCEIVGFIKALVVDHRIEMPESLADAWLSYRYQYGTGKMDVQDAIKFVHRRMDLGTLDRLISSYGTCSHTVNGVEVTCRCSIGVKPRNVDLLHRIWRALDTYGLTPDFYVIWDSIPYSFIVDWFLPIGDITSVLDASRMYFSGEFYDFEGICLSLSYNREMGNSNVHCYTRWAGSVPTELHSRYWLEGPSTSLQTWVKRLLDAGSIFIG